MGCISTGLAWNTLLLAITKPMDPDLSLHLWCHTHPIFHPWLMALKLAEWKNEYLKSLATVFYIQMFYKSRHVNNQNLYSKAIFPTEYFCLVWSIWSRVRALGLRVGNAEVTPRARKETGIIGMVARRQPGTPHPALPQGRIRGTKCPD